MLVVDGAELLGHRGIGGVAKWNDAESSSGPREEERVGAEMENDRVLLETSSPLASSGTHGRMISLGILVVLGCV